MVNEEILGGIESAISRGQSMRNAMMSFYNAGYKKEEIEEAAKLIQISLAGRTTTPSQTQTAHPIAQKQITKPTKPQVKIPYQIHGQVGQKQGPIQQVKQLPQGQKLAVNVEKARQMLHERHYPKYPQKIIKRKIHKIRPHQIPQFATRPSPRAVSAYDYKQDLETAKLKRMFVKTLKELRRTEKEIPRYEQKVPTIQRISGYGKESLKPISKTTTIVLIVILVILLLSLGLIFFFKSQVIDFFNRVNIG